MTWRKTLAFEFQMKNFGFSGVPQDRFYMWQWRVPPIAMILYKILLSAYLMSSLIYNVLTFEDSSGIPWPAFVTNWTYTLLMTYHVVHTVVLLLRYMTVTCHTCLQQPSGQEHFRHFYELQESDPLEETQLAVPSQQRGDHLPPHLIFLWILYSILNSICPIVTALWYTSVATPEERYLPRELCVHVLNTVAILVDQMVSAIPVRLLHACFPVSYGLVYYLFSILYWMADHKHVLYGKMLDWNHPAIPFVMVIVTSCAAAVLHAGTYCIYKARLSIYHRLERG
ncbi:protein rolling stone-like [Haliotis cracherodii]|uniref:protein rolling stone-like n=1 Tax=Haliotis cracherodii TaxID=6455 RepID=UPI0039EC3BC1